MGYADSLAYPPMGASPLKGRHERVAGLLGREAAAEGGAAGQAVGAAGSPGELSSGAGLTTSSDPEGRVTSLLSRKEGREWLQEAAMCGEGAVTVRGASDGAGENGKAEDGGCNKEGRMHFFEALLGRVSRSFQVV